MALETVIFQQDPFIYGCKDYTSCNMGGGYGFGLQPSLHEQKPNAENLDAVNGQQGSNRCWDSPPSSGLAHNPASSPDTCGGAGDGFFSCGGYSPAVVAASRRKRRRTKSMKNKEEMENQRMTHIAVERNRRRQMNDYLSILRSLMPPSYAQRGDQASIVGGAINFVKELEQLLQFLESHKPSNFQQPNAAYSNLLSNFFTFPQYSTCLGGDAMDAAAERRSAIADIEVAMVETHANIKILTKRRPKQLLKMVAAFQSIYLTILHLKVTTVDQSVLYSFSVKVEDECQLSTVNEIATSVHDLVGMIQEESVCS
ncbi:Transcription factor HAND2/Transcription factor TAL1/TAL2/LYL1 [Handroanthus impetiginosus]|uniref:Transcription factor HAND2/Transcription factor TAL1/TAL2/LYL1 n=1 Tax=Handroanthus impetiginosus TaxID=429701 RepID=A0A2G9I4C8_9LAMI|nr:Transcription factor HAND2/Transcription factor TAL1/TAL2/LYL1 [Handroanthus impetiginosus]